MNHQPMKKLINRLVTPEKALQKIKPGMNIFIGTGSAEPRTLVKQLMASDAENLRDLELIQLASLGDVISLEELQLQKYRLKTFYSGWVASEAITQGRVDLIPSRVSKIPSLIESRQVPIDVAFLQITPPNEAGYCSLGIAVDVVHHVLETASLVIGEVNNKIPQTHGDTFVNINKFDIFVASTDDPIYFDRWPMDEVFDAVAANIASIIDDGCCLFFSLGPLFEALGRHLTHKRNLGIHAPFITDPLMDLIKSGAVTNRYKEVWRGKTVVSYALGTAELMGWLDRNPLVEFQSVDKVYNSLQIGKNKNYRCILPARKVDLSGRITLHIGKGQVMTSPAEIIDFFNGAEISPGGLTIFALPSRNLKNESNIKISLKNFPNQFSLRESVDMIVTEYGVAYLSGRTIRERAQALVEIAHPEDRLNLIEEAKKEKIIYEDQIFIEASASFYPAEIVSKHTFKGDTEIKFRAIKPSDEEGMRRLFYRFSDKAVYYRYFSPIKTMPHAKMQEYVNVDYRKTMSIVGLEGKPGKRTIIAEARYVKDNNTPPFADIAFVVDEKYQGLGIATYLYKMLARIARDRGIQGFTADVLSSNTAMMKVFEKVEGKIQANLDCGVYAVRIPFNKETLF